MIIAVTRNDETNMIVCQLASSLFNVSKKLHELGLKISWRVNGESFLINLIFQLMLLFPEVEVAKSLYRRLEAPGALDNVPFGDNKVKMLEISIEKIVPLKNIPLKS